VSEPWGTKVTVSIYGRGDGLAEAAEMLSCVGQFVAEVEKFGPVEFAGMKVESLADEPKDQVAS
jgi:hypothetical protein